MGVSGVSVEAVPLPEPDLVEEPLLLALPEDLFGVVLGVAVAGGTVCACWGVMTWPPTLTGEGASSSAWSSPTPKGRAPGSAPVSGWR